MREPGIAPELVAPVGGGEDGLVREGEELLRGVEHLLGGIEHTLVSLEDGSYGHCSTCAAVLPAAALAKDPLLHYCDAHGEPA